MPACPRAGPGVSGAGSGLPRERRARPPAGEARRRTVRYGPPMLAATAVRTDASDPLAGLDIGERPDPAVPEGWTTVSIRAASLNHHDVWTLRGVGISQDRLPI